jgi:hypothetical protein
LKNQKSLSADRQAYPSSFTQILTLIANKTTCFTQSYLETAPSHFIFDHLIAVLFVTSIHHLLHLKPA